jgi:glutathione synthase/RimK-type ligase-like ATP-grasp enzyme
MNPVYNSPFFDINSVHQCDDQLECTQREEGCKFAPVAFTGSLTIPSPDAQQSIQEARQGNCVKKKIPGSFTLSLFRATTPERLPKIVRLAPRV